MAQASWILTVSDESTTGGVRWAYVTAQPDDEDAYAALAVRFKQVGMRAVSRSDWNAVRLPLTPCMVSVEDDHITEVHTSRSRILCSPPVKATANWLAAASRGRVVLVLVRPGTIPVVGADRALPEEFRELSVEQVLAAADRREVHAGLARVLDGPAPHPGRR